jgi:hypothetical protein
VKVTALELYVRVVDKRVAVVLRHLMLADLEVIGNSLLDEVEELPLVLDHM